MAQIFFLLSTPNIISLSLILLCDSLCVCKVLTETMDHCRFLQKVQRPAFCLFSPFSHDHLAQKVNPRDAIGAISYVEKVIPIGKDLEEVRFPRFRLPKFLMLIFFQGVTDDPWVEEH